MLTVPQVASALQKVLTLERRTFGARKPVRATPGKLDGASVVCFKSATFGWLAGPQE